MTRLVVSGPPFTPEQVDGLPEPARRWLGRVIEPGTPLWSSVELEMTGEIRLGRWRRFTATELLSPARGFAWSACTRLAGLPVSGHDRYLDGVGEMRWRLAGVLPVISASGPDVTRSAAGRLAAEGLFLLPTSFSRASWTLLDPNRVLASLWSGARAEEVELHVGATGRLRSLTMRRWGNPGGGPYHDHRFTVTALAERHDQGITIPSQFRAMWGPETTGEDGEFFRATITAARFR